MATVTITAGGVPSTDPTRGSCGGKGSNKCGFVFGLGLGLGFASTSGWIRSSETEIGDQLTIEQV